MTPIDDTMAKDLILSCCKEVNNSFADHDKYQMNRSVKKWASKSEGSDNFAT